MAAAEEQEEGVVALLGGGGLRLGVRRLLAAVAGGRAAGGVDEPRGRDRRQPRARVARRVRGPHPQRLQQRLLQRVLGGIEVLAPPDQAREHLRDESPQRPLVQPSRRLVDHAASVVRGRSHMTSRTSIHSYSGSPPGPGSEETYAASSTARSRDSTSIIHQPATRSLVSGCGPSVVTGAASGPPYRTQVRAGVSPCTPTYSPFSWSTSVTCLMKAMCASTSSGAHWSIGGWRRCGSGPP